MATRRPLSAAALTDASVFALLALALALPSGYSLGALLLLALGLAAWPAVLTGRAGRSPALGVWAIAVVLMGLVWSMHMTDGSGRLITHSLGLDRVLKYLAVLLALPALLVRRPQAWALRWGCAVGACGAGLTAAWQVMLRHMARAEGYTNAIQFGNLALLLGVCSGIWALHAPARRARWAGWIGAALGLAASLASGSRGGWVVLPLLLLLALWLAPRPQGRAQGRHGWRALGVTALVCAMLALLPPVQQRAERAANEYLRAEQRMDDTSIGLRLAFWRQAWADGQSNPWVGVGQSGYEQLQREAVAHGLMPAQAVEFNHAHNEWLDMFAKRGLLGVIGLLLFYAVPGALFWRGLRQQANQATPDAGARHAAAVCGLATVLGFVGFGMTQVMFAHNNGNLMYLLLVSLWLAVCWQGPGAAATEAAPPASAPASAAPSP